MSRRIALALFVVAAVLAPAVPARAVTVAPALVIGGNFPDPDLLTVDGRWYAYATNTGGANVPVAVASSLRGAWTRSADALPRLGAWARTGLTWAPDVSRRSDGRYLMYYTARSAAIERQCIGAALADSPTGPFTPVGSAALVCNAAEAGDIDPASYVDTDGRRYLLYKSDGNAIGVPTVLYLQEVAADGVTFVGGRTELLRSGRADEAGVIEAPVLKRAESGRYVLFYSQGGYGGDGYAVGYATSGALRGPYTKAARPLVSTASVNNTVRGPGGQDVVDGAVVFHGWVNNNTARSVYVADLGWDNGLPVVRGSRVRYEAEAGVLVNCRVRTGAVGASNQSVAAYIDTAASYVEVSVFAPRAGTYTAYIGYAAGSGAAQHALTVNGGAARIVDYPARGWDVWSQVAVDVSLNAGRNTLRLTHRTAFAEIDYVEIA